MLKNNLIFNRHTDKKGGSNVDASNTDKPEYMSDNDSDAPDILNSHCPRSYLLELKFVDIFENIKL